MDLFIAYSELWGKGIGTRVVKAMSDYLIHLLGATVVCADPGEENGRSVACWLKAGFIPIGKVADYDEPDNQCILMAYSDNQRLMDKLITGLNYTPPPRGTRGIGHPFCILKARYALAIANCYDIDLEEVIKRKEEINNQKYHTVFRAN